VVTDHGARLSTRRLEGKVVLLDFWGSWCPPCRETVGELRQIWKRYGRRGDFVILSIDSREKRPAGQKFIAAHHMVWPQFWDAHAALEKAFGVRAYPTFILLDRRGVIRGWWTGEYGWRTGGFLDSVVQRWLRRKAG
jgi:thiol-disulfide isomerase/thioredoxin